MATATAQQPPGPVASVSATAWYRLATETVARVLNVDASRGLTTAEVSRRLEQYGPNRLSEKEKEPGWRAFLRQYRDLMQIVLVAAAVVNQIVTGETGTTVVLIGLTMFNALLALNQESKAEAALASLQQMLKTIARVRRDGQVLEIEAENLVPGDIVLLEAGNVLPADGRLFVAATLEIEEAALTGESVPVLKNVAEIDKPEVALGDRLCMAYMNTSVTRGRAEMFVTGTGMDTEIGKIAGMLNTTKAEKTPLQKKLDELTRIFIVLGGVAILAVIVLGLFRDEDLETLFITGVALAIACIPTGLPAVVTSLLSLGTRELAQQNAIVKRLPAVETLGSTSAICSDKTGTLTLNKMTARDLVIPGPGNRFKVSGEGYGTTGTITHTGGENVDLDEFLLPMILCADASLDGESLIGDPTEGALIVLAAKGGLDIDETRQTYPRVAEVPFDSDYKFMATFHNMTGTEGKPVVRCFVKGAPDVMISRSTSYWHPESRDSQPITDENRQRALDVNDAIAASGERVMAVARRDFDPATFNPKAGLLGEINDLTLLAMVGIVDPPRAEAKTSIAECTSAGIRVRMITGDHATTAAAIGRELGIEGRALTGAEFAAMSDEQISSEINDIGVIARVAPEDKVRLVRLLQEKGEVVSMTGDGVNDAPALKKADIGVAMGITGTEVSKGAAVMIITDDNFSTIVRAVSHGRALYDNLLKYIRFQMASLVGYLALFVGAGIFNVANGIPLEPLALLWINFAIDIPIAIALGFDESTPGLMKRKPRPASAPVLSRQQWIRLTVTGLIMAGCSLAVRAWAEDEYSIIVGATMLLVTLSLFHVIAGLSVREEYGTIFSRDSLPAWPQLRLYGLVLLLTVLVTSIELLQRIFLTTSLTVNQWLICAGVALTLLVFEEGVKLFLRSRRSGG